MFGNRSESMPPHVEEGATGAFRAAELASIARATSSLGASSSTKRSPRAFTSSAPSPRTASVTRNPSSVPLA